MARKKGKKVQAGRENRSDTRYNGREGPFRSDPWEKKSTWPAKRGLFKLSLRIILL